MTIAITGASGGLGRLAAERLLDRVAPSEVVLISRSPDELVDLADRGAQVRHGDFTAPDTLPAAFAGVEKLLLISTDTVGARLDQQRGAITAAVFAGVEHVVYTSIPEPVDANPAAVVPDHKGTEEALQANGIDWTILRNNLYAHMQVPNLRHIAAEHRLVTNAGDGATAYVTREDCAAAAVAVLTQDGHAGKTYDVTGPEAFTADDLAALAAELSGQPVEVDQVSDEELIAGMTAGGLPAPVAQLLASFGASTRGGFLANVTTAVKDLTGEEATSLRHVIAVAGITPRD
jgi:NAD(P)H dehydrogenase (quinone)